MNKHCRSVLFKKNEWWDVPGRQTGCALGERVVAGDEATAPDARARGLSHCAVCMLPRREPPGFGWLPAVHLEWSGGWEGPRWCRCSTWADLSSSQSSQFHPSPHPLPSAAPAAWAQLLPAPAWPVSPMHSMTQPLTFLNPSQLNF